MGVPGTRASLLSLVKHHPTKNDQTTRAALLYRTHKRSFQPNRSLITLSHQHQPFFEPSISILPLSDCSSTNPSVLLPSRHHTPTTTTTTTTSTSTTPTTSSSSSSPRPPVTRATIAVTGPHESHPNESDPDPSTSHPGSSTSLSPFKTPLNLYGHPIEPHRPTQSILPSHQKHYYGLINGASGIPKNEIHSLRFHQDQETSEELSVQVGEDAYFLRGDSLGVADGVGGWSGKAGANSAWFSNRLMHHCSFELGRYEDTQDHKFIDYRSIDPVEILQRAYEKSLDESKLEGIVGSTTALLAILRDDELRIANLGDCSCSIIRGNDYIFRTEEQQHSFNYPVQIGTNSKSSPIKDAQRYNVKVQKDDIVILSSDGLVDNLFDEDILEEVLSRRPCRPDRVSEALASRAKTVSIDQLAVASPFSQRANQEGIHYVGGKNDDISVLVAVVRDL